MSSQLCGTAARHLPGVHSCGRDAAVDDLITRAADVASRVHDAERLVDLVGAERLLIGTREQRRDV